MAQLVGQGPPPSLPTDVSGAARTGIAAGSVAGIVTQELLRLEPDWSFSTRQRLQALYAAEST
jgi:hypothetical protein